MTAPVLIVKTTKSAANMTALMAQAVSGIPATMTMIVPSIILKRVASDLGTTPRPAYLVTAVLAKAVPVSLIVLLIRHAAQSALEGKHVLASSAHPTPIVPVVRSAAVKNVKLDRTASVNLVPATATVKAIPKNVAKANVQRVHV